jgi:hypothetical protein
MMVYRFKKQLLTAVYLKMRGVQGVQEDFLFAVYAFYLSDDFYLSIMMSNIDAMFQNVANLERLNIDGRISDTKTDF